MPQFHTPHSTVPCIAQIDVLVVGSTATAVGAALAAKSAGAATFLVSDRSYVGEEIAGSFQPIPRASECGPLLGGIFQEAGAEATPLTVKRLLEKALMEREIPFLFNARPIRLLTGSDGTVNGVIFAARCVWFAVRAKEVIDATPHGIVAGLGPWAKRERTNLSAEFAMLVPGDEIEVPDPGKASDRYSIRRSQHAVGATSVAEWAGVEQSVRIAAASLEQTRTADALRMISPWGFYDLPEACGLTLLGTAAFSDELAAEMLASGKLLELSESIGKRAADAAFAKTLADVDLAVSGEIDANGDLCFGPAPIRWQESEASIAFDSAEFPVLEEVDVLVVGGGTGGAPAAIGAAREGAKTLLIELLPGLGGVGTLGMIGKYYFGNRVGFTEELDRGIAQLTADAGKKYYAGAADGELKMGWYLDQITRSGGQVWFGSFAFAVQKKDNRVRGVFVTTPFGCGLVRAKNVIDATGNADIAAAAGAPCREIGAHHVGVQGTGLPPRRPTVYYRNTDYTFVDENDPVNVTQSFATGRRKFKGEFDLAQLIDTRERRQIIGELELSPLDFLADRTFPDTFVIAKSNFDTHGFTVHPVFMAVPPDKKPLQARVPMRCLLPKGLEGVFVTGLGVSAHRDAIPVIRMQPDVQNQGFAAGLSAALAAKRGLALRELPMRELQVRFVALGILPESVLTEEDSFPLPEETVRAAVTAEKPDHSQVAVILGNAERSIPLLKERLETAKDEASVEFAALLLGLLGESGAAPALMDRVAKASWDKGWNYTGMGQYGLSLSRLDSMIVALGRTGDRRCVPILVEKINSLTGESEFSHCRALALAACCLRSEQLAAPLAAALGKPGMAGHAWTNLTQVVEGVQPDPEETRPRSDSLRELALARGLFHSGDHEGLGRATLETYGNDLRGHYANHARAVLQEKIDTTSVAEKALRVEIA